MRANSVPVTVVRNATSFGKSAGNPASRTLRTRPSRRYCSIERAATWLHLTFGASSRARVSTTATSTPRPARSIASVRPTGPAPTTTTSASLVLMQGVSVQLDSGRLHELAPLLRLGADVGFERLAALGHGLDAELADARLHRIVVERRVDGGMQGCDDLRGCRRRRDDAEPPRRVVAGNARLGHRRH